MNITIFDIKGQLDYKERWLFHESLFLLMDRNLTDKIKLKICDDLRQTLYNRLSAIAFRSANQTVRDLYDKGSKSVRPVGW